MVFANHKARLFRAGGGGVGVGVHKKNVSLEVLLHNVALITTET